jgi:hypothetical protein
MGSRSILLFLLLAPCLVAGGPANPAQVTRFYFVDVGHGNATFVVTASGETVLLDAGATRAAGRVLAFMEQNGIKKIDYAIISHFEDDHMGGAPLIAAKVPILNFVDHGTSVVYEKDDAWWKQRRGPWFREGMGKMYDRSFEAYRQARDKSHHMPVKAGDKIPIRGLDVQVVSAAGKTIVQPMIKNLPSVAACASIDKRAEDDAEDGQSLGVVLRHGKFRFIYLGDLTWNTANALFCPKNLVGQVGAYVITHHAQSMSKQFGDYYYGLSCCSAAEVHGLNPQVAMLSLGALGHRDATPAAMQVVHGVSGLDLWQTEFIREGGERGYNGPEDFIANLGQKSDTALYIELEAHADGSFTMRNSRNGYTKTYPPRK